MTTIIRPAHRTLWAVLPLMAYLLFLTLIQGVEAAPVIDKKVP